jgi:hypothetical protein
MNLLRGSLFAYRYLPIGEKKEFPSVPSVALW